MFFILVDTIILKKRVYKFCFLKNIKNRLNKKINLWKNPQNLKSMLQRIEFKKQHKEDGKNLLFNSEALYSETL